MTDQQKPTKRNLTDEWKLIRRAFGILNRLFPNFWILEIACTFWATIFPYFGLCMSSLMVNELAGTCDPKRLLALAGITVC